MTFLIILGIYCAILFAVAFLSRRFVALASLALCAGAVLAKLWTNDLTPMVAGAGVHLISPPLGSIVAIILTIVPAILVLAKSPKVAKRQHGILSSVVFAVLGVMLTYGAFSNGVVLDEQSKHAVLQILAQEKWILTAGIVLAVSEVLVFHKPHHHTEDRRK